MLFRSLTTGSIAGIALGGLCTVYMDTAGININQLVKIGAITVLSVFTITAISLVQIDGAMIVISAGIVTTNSMIVSCIFITRLRSFFQLT